MASESFSALYACETGLNDFFCRRDQEQQLAEVPAGLCQTHAEVVAKLEGIEYGERNDRVSFGVHSHAARSYLPKAIRARGAGKRHELQHIYGMTRASMPKPQRVSWLGLGSRS